MGVGLVSGLVKELKDGQHLVELHVHYTILTLQLTLYLIFRLFLCLETMLQYLKRKSQYSVSLYGNAIHFLLCSIVKVL